MKYVHSGGQQTFPSSKVKSNQGAFSASNNLHFLPKKCKQLCRMSERITDCKVLQDKIALSIVGSLCQK